MGGFPGPIPLPQCFFLPGFYLSFFPGFYLSFFPGFYLSFFQQGRQFVLTFFYFCWCVSVRLTPRWMRQAWGQVIVKVQCGHTPWAARQTA